ncbi:MAG: Uma2 family endonuclease [Chloroflexota bacterium]
MALNHPITTVDEFDAFVLRDENIERNFEYIGGEIVQKMVSNDAAAIVASYIQGFIFIYLRANRIGRVMGDNTGYMVGSERYIPDVSYISYEKHPDILRIPYRPDPPDLAIEVISSERADEADNLAVKVQHYLLAGTVVWIINPFKRTVTVFIAQQKPVTLHEGDVLTGGKVLPDFKLDLETLFEELPE